MSRPIIGRFETLESRLALAGMATFTDVDGDTVTVRTDRGTDAMLAAAITLAPAGGVGGFQLQQINLNDPAFARTNLEITARPSFIGGDARVDVGEVVSSFDLGGVAVGGDLGRILAGDGNLTTPGIGSFVSKSIGARGTATGAGDTFSFISGSVTSMRLSGDLTGARMQVIGRAVDVVISGSIIGTNASDGIEARSIGRIVVGGGLFGGATAESGRIATNVGGITRVVIGGDLVGGAGDNSGVVASASSIGFARIGGSISGGSGDSCGVVFAGGAGISQLVVGMNIFGGSNQYSGLVQTVGSIGSATVGGSLVGGVGTLSGGISVARRIETVSIGGDMVGGIGYGSGAVSAFGRIGTLRVNRILAGDGPLSGSVGARSLGTIVVRGDISGSTLQPVVISAVGSTSSSGPRAIDSLTVGGTMNKTLVLGGYNATTPVNGAARIGAVTIRGSMFGSSIVAGVENINPTPSLTGMPQFGDGFDVAIGGSRGSRIGSLVVVGIAEGGIDPLQSSGVVANSIGSVRITGRNYTVTRAGIMPTSNNLVFRLI